MKHLLLVALLAAACATAPAEPRFPVTPEVFIDAFRASEGLTFNGEGKLFIGANSAVWIAEPDGTVRKITEVFTHLGQAGIGERDILAADFGPTTIFREGPNDDGIVWRITPEGEKRYDAIGIGDPNFILVLKDGSYLVSDDGVDKIYRVKDGEVSIWSDAIDYPNGMVLSLDEKTLYVAQIFTQLNPVKLDDKIWAIPFSPEGPTGPPELIARTGGAGVDGLAMDERGRIYIADNNAGKIWRLDPRTRQLVLIAEGMSNVASLAFGEGEFDHESIYATTTMRGGGTIWRVKVGVRGAPMVR